MTEHTPEAQRYARETLGMGEDEPNDATGYEGLMSYLSLVFAFDAGRASMVETVTTVESAQELPVGSVFIGYYYPPTFSVLQRRTLASMQFTRGVSIIYGERAEYPLTQPFERIEVLFRPDREEGTE